MEPSEPLDLMHRPSLDFTSRPSKFAGASLLVSCIRCEGLHSPANPFEFNPVCPACSGGSPLSALAMRGSYPFNL